MPKKTWCRGAYIYWKETFLPFAARPETRIDPRSSRQTTSGFLLFGSGKKSNLYHAEGPHHRRPQICRHKMRATNSVESGWATASLLSKIMECSRVFPGLLSSE